MACCGAAHQGGEGSGGDGGQGAVERAGGGSFGTRSSAHRVRTRTKDSSSSPHPENMRTTPTVAPRELFFLCSVAGRGGASRRSDPSHEVALDCGLCSCRCCSLEVDTVLRCTPAGGEDSSTAKGERGGDGSGRVVDVQSEGVGSTRPPPGWRGSALWDAADPAIVGRGVREGPPGEHRQCTRTLARREVLRQGERGGREAQLKALERRWPKRKRICYSNRGSVQRRRHGVAPRAPLREMGCRPTRPSGAASAAGRAEGETQSGATALRGEGAFLEP